MTGELAGTEAWMWPTTTPMATRHSSWLRPVFLRTSSISSAPMVLGTAGSATTFSSVVPRLSAPRASSSSGAEGVSTATSSVGGSGAATLEEGGCTWDTVVWAPRRGTGGGVGEQLGPGSDELEPVQSVSREVLLTEEPLDTELAPEGVVLRPPVGREWMLCWGSPLDAPIPPSPEPLSPLPSPPHQAQSSQLPQRVPCLP